jgi:hypothetical protein
VLEQGRRSGRPAVRKACSIAGASGMTLVEGAMEDELTFVAVGQCFCVNGARVVTWS